MKVSEISFLAKLVLGYFKKYWNTKAVRKIAFEIRTGIDDLLSDDDEFQ